MTILSDGGKGAGLIMEALLTALGAGTNDVLAAFLGSICGSFFLPDSKPRHALELAIQKGRVLLSFATLAESMKSWAGKSSFAI